MAKLIDGSLGFIGTVQGLSIYKRRDIDTPIVRKKGGPSRRMVKTHANFDSTRRINKEFGGRSTMSSFVMTGIRSLKKLCDYNIAGPLNGLLRSIQLLDTTSRLGQRGIEVSRNPSLLEGFQLNRKNVFEAVCTNGIAIDISKEQGSATLHTPNVIPGTNFFPVGTYPVYRWEAALTVIPDLTFDGNEYKSTTGNGNYITHTIQGDWYSVVKPVAFQKLHLQVDMKHIPANASYSLMLAVGISFGVMAPDGGRQVEYAGAGKIVRVV